MPDEYDDFVETGLFGVRDVIVLVRLVVVCAAVVYLIARLFGWPGFSW